MTTSFRLTVQQVEQTCLFELTWGQGQQLTAMLQYSELLTQLYQNWQQAYLKFYTALPATRADDIEGAMRGRVLAETSVARPVNWHTQLVEAETRLLSEFHRWLRSAELFEIRAAIARASRGTEKTELHNINVFLTCRPLELARFPWEAWEIGTDFAATGMIQVVRTPANVPSEPYLQRGKQGHRARILAVLGDDTGLNFQTDRLAVASLARIAEVKFVGWQPGREIEEVKTEIKQAITHEAGWDILFFAGHSNESAAGGGLAIAPKTSIHINELLPQLTIAKQQGLQFAIFNSCSGLSIAETLIGLGFSQVAIMREPIHNRVAQEFLVNFVYSLAEHKNVHEALIAACQFLKLEKNLTYPSAYHVPSLFCHPGAELFRIQPSGWKQRLRQLAPLRVEALALAACLGIGLIPQVQDLLLDQRTATQAIYRNLTGQVPPPNTPPVLLVQIDEKSVSRDQRLADDPAPISRRYLADLINRLAERHAKIIGIDYLLDRPVSNREELSRALQSAVQKHQTWFVFGSLPQNELRGAFVAEEGETAQRTWSLQGHMAYWYRNYPNYITLPYSDDTCYKLCPLGYLLALLHSAQQDPGTQLPQPQLDSGTDLRTQVLDAVRQNSHPSPEIAFIQHSQLGPLTSWVARSFKLIWWQPIIDYSIPPDRVYTRLASWRLLDDASLKLPLLSQQIVVIGAGDYTDVDSAINRTLDYYPTPPSAVKYWREQLPSGNSASDYPDGQSKNSSSYLEGLTGAEAHAYMAYQLLNQQLVFPIPHVWMVGITGIVSRGVVILLKRRRQQSAWTRRRQIRYMSVLASSTLLYGLAGLQLYVWVGILLPWVLPSAMFWMYILPVLKRR